MKIISAYTKDIKELSDISFDSYYNYCKNNNIELERFEITETERPPSWYKIKLILKQFDLGYEYVMWVDADTLLVNNEFNIKNIIDNVSQIYLCDDFNGINCGVMIWKKTDITKNILNKMWELTNFIYHGWWEQAAFRYLYDNDYNNIKSIVKKIPQKIMNSYDYKLYGKTCEDGQVTEESFIFHLPGIPNNKRMDIMKNFKI